SRASSSSTRRKAGSASATPAAASRGQRLASLTRFSAARQRSWSMRAWRMAWVTIAKKWVRSATFSSVVPDRSRTIMSLTSAVGWRVGLWHGAGGPGSGGSAGVEIGGGVYNLGTFAADVVTVVKKNHASTSNDD